jgi:hypothetical protein
MVNAQAEKDRNLIARREELRKEYYTGELRPPYLSGFLIVFRTEKLITIANGHPDNESVIAARRILDKNSIKWC